MLDGSARQARLGLKAGVSARLLGSQGLTFGLGRKTRKAVSKAHNGL
jgi:hypothetical protein